MKSFASSVTSTYSGNLISSYTCIISFVRFCLDPALSKFGRESYPEDIHKPSCQSPKYLSSHRRNSQSRPTESSREESQRLFASFRFQSKLPSQNRRSWLCPAYKYKYKVKEDVLRLDVSMNYLLFVYIVQALADFTDDRAALRLLHAMSFSEQLE